MTSKTQSAASLNMTTLVFTFVADGNFVAALDAVATFVAAEFARVAAENPVDLDTFDPVAFLMNWKNELDPEKVAVVADALVGLDFVVGQMKAEVADADAKGADWAARVYKKNSKKVTVGDPDRVGDYPWAHPTATFKIDTLNENRRARKVAEYKADGEELDGYLAIADKMKAAIETGYFGDFERDTFFAKARKVHEERSGW